MLNGETIADAGFEAETKACLENLSKREEALFRQAILPLLVEKFGEQEALLILERSEAQHRLIQSLVSRE